MSAYFFFRTTIGQPLQGGDQCLKEMIAQLSKKATEVYGGEDPVLVMVQWMANKLMEVEVKQKVQAEKGKYATERVAYRARRFDTQVGK
jgi:hypothetical protein